MVCSFRIGGIYRGKIKNMYFKDVEIPNSKIIGNNNLGLVNAFMDNTAIWEQEEVSDLTPLALVS